MEGAGPRAEGRGADEAPTTRALVRGFRDLVAWQLSYGLALSVIRLASKFPSDERFCLTSQIRRSAVSVPSNIAEGFGRGSRAEYVRFLYIARGSLYELDTQLNLAKDLGYINQQQFVDVHQQIDESERVLWGLIRALENRSSKPAVSSSRS